MNSISRTWPTDTMGRVPYWVYSDPGIYAAEMERVWYRPHWLYCGLEAEIPNVGDFKTTTIGERPVIMTRSGRTKSRWWRTAVPTAAKILPGAQRQRQRPALPVSSMVLRFARKPDGLPLPPRRARSRRDAGRFRPRGSWPAQAEGGGRERRGMGHVLQDTPGFANISGSGSGSTTPASTTGGSWGCLATTASTLRATGN